MPEKNDEQRLNPQITETQIGIRNLRTIKIYPLSIPDQLKMTDLITEALNAFFQREDQGDIVFVSFLIELVKNNLTRILEMITDEKGEKILSKITNYQASEIAKIIYEVNYESAAKNVKGLFERVKGFLVSERPSQMFANDILNTDLKTSTEKAGEKEESPSGN